MLENNFSTVDTCIVFVRALNLRHLWLRAYIWLIHYKRLFLNRTM